MDSSSQEKGLLTCVLIAAVLLTTCSYVVDSAAVASLAQCDDVKTAYLNMGYSALDVPTSSVVLPGDDLQICPAGFSCCTRDMEIQLAENSRQKFDQQFISSMARATDLLSTATSDFHKFFTDEIETAHTELDDMFTTAYQATYTNNKDVFTNLYTKFKKYYTGDDIDIQQVVVQFFRDLFVKLFVLHNGGRQFTDDYLSCVASKLETIKPFKDLPDLLQRNIEQALLGSRTFIQGLAVGRNVALTTLKIEPTMACSKAHTKMTFCSHCRGLPSLKPCHNYCMNVMRGCLAYRAELNSTWPAYIDAMDMLGLRLEGDGSFNLESVFSPLKDQISLAIMDYQTTSVLINDLVSDDTNGCGPAPGPSSSPPFKVKRSADGNTPSLPRRHKSSARLKHHINRIRHDLIDLKDLWTSTLPNTMCQAVDVESGSGTCWNGEDSASYAKILMTDGLQANANNPEVNVDPSRQDETIVNLNEQLTQITSSIHQAVQGQTVSWLTLQMKSSLQGSQSLVDFKLQFGSGLGERYTTDSEGSGSEFGIIPIVWGTRPKVVTYYGSGDGSGDMGYDGIDDDEDKQPLPDVRPTAIAHEVDEPVVVTESRKPEATTATPRGSMAAVKTSNYVLLCITMLISLAFTKL